MIHRRPALLVQGPELAPRGASAGPAAGTRAAGRGGLDDSGSGIRCIGHRMDYLVVAYRGRLRATTQRVCERIATMGPSPFRVGLTEWSAQQVRPGLVLARNARWIVRISTVDPFSLELTATGETLISTSIEDIRDEARAIASELIVVDADGSERVRRIDLAADIAGWQIDATEGRRLVRRSRSTLATWRCDADDREPTRDPAVAEYAVASVPTGFVICPGNALLCRIYDKRAELRLPAREAKLAREKQAWPKDLSDDEPLTRVEFQLRRDFLRSCGTSEDGKVIPAPIETLDDLLLQIDRLWRYLSRWVRLELDAPRRAGRRPLDERWVAVQAIVWRHETVEDFRRFRLSSGISVGRFIGSAIWQMRETMEDMEGAIVRGYAAALDSGIRAGDDAARAAWFNVQREWIEELSERLPGVFSKKLNDAWLHAIARRSECAELRVRLKERPPMQWPPKEEQ